MPGWFSTPINRQSFLKISMATVAGSLVQIARSPSAQGSTSFAGANRFALLSDTHIAMDPKEEYRGFKPATNLQVVVQQVCDGQYESAFLNGDAARLEGKQEDYDHLKKLLAPVAERCPIAIGLGNHDDRDTFKKVFETKETPEAKETNRHVTVVDSQFVRWILLDSLLFVNKTPGHLGKQQRTWLRNYLASAGTKPTLIMVHHTLGDNDGELLDARELLEIAKGSPAVKGIFYGHSHKYEFKRDGKLHLINLPSVGYNFGDTEPVGWMEAVSQENGIRLTLRAIAGDQSKNGETTTLVWE